VTRKNGMEASFTGEYWDFFGRGVYVDVTTGEPLFLSKDKLESGCGGPSFSAPASPGMVVEEEGRGHGIKRTEMRGRSGDEHQGHVFTDGPKQKGDLRYCIDSAALRFIPYEKMERRGTDGLWNPYECAISKDPGSI
jgi:methionine-R-sulfoxide reductase